MPNDVIAEAHAGTMKLGLREVVERLNRHLGATLVATLAGVKDPKLPYRWAREGSGDPNQQAANRLRAAHRVWVTIADAESDHVARAWFVGENPYLGEQAPVLALREGRIRETLLAAQAFLGGTWQG
jgi:hypothetical protein